MEAGIEAGTEAGIEAGTEAGIEAGAEAGTEAGIEAGTEAAIPVGAKNFAPFRNHENFPPDHDHGDTSRRGRPVCLPCFDVRPVGGSY